MSGLWLRPCSPSTWWGPLLTVYALVFHTSSTTIALSPTISSLPNHPIVHPYSSPSVIYCILLVIDNLFKMIKKLNTYFCFRHILLFGGLG